MRPALRRMLGADSLLRPQVTAEASEVLSSPPGQPLVPARHRRAAPRTGRLVGALGGSAGVASDGRAGGGERAAGEYRRIRRASRSAGGSWRCCWNGGDDERVGRVGSAADARRRARRGADGRRRRQGRHLADGGGRPGGLSSPRASSSCCAARGCPRATRSVWRGSRASLRREAHAGPHPAVPSDRRSAASKVELELSTEARRDLRPGEDDRAHRRRDGGADRRRGGRD